MPLTEQDLLSIREILHRLIGLRLWYIYRDEDRKLVLHFDVKSHPDDAKKIVFKADWGLWVYACAWRIETNTEMLAGSQDEEEKLTEVFERLENHCLISISLSRPALETVLSFENNLVLRLFPWTSSGFINWRLFTPSKEVLTTHSGALWDFQDFPKHSDH